MQRLVRWFFNWYYRFFPPEMVRYWKRSDSARCKVVFADDGHMYMIIEGEKYPYPGFPRGHLLFGSMRELKHIVKNKLFNDTWEKLEQNIEKSEILNNVKSTVIDEIIQMTELCKADMVPYQKMVPPVKELWRAWSKIEDSVEDPIKKKKLRKLKEALCFIMQEDDAYRLRMQWIVQFFNPSSLVNKLFGRRNMIKAFGYSLERLEDAEIVGDMKGRIRLLRRVLLLLLEDPTIKKLFDQLCEEMDWNKLKLTKADRYYFRGKYFKVDHRYYDY